MKKILKKVRDLMVTITLSKPKEFDRLRKKSDKGRKRGGDKKGGKCSS